jgi:uncharacterized protein (DUF2236 family)
MLAAEMMLIPREQIPPSVPALRAWLADFEDRGELLVTEGARRVYELFLDPPREAEWRPVLKGVSRLAFGTLPPLLRDMYGVPMSPAKHTAMRATFAAIRAGRPLLPAKFRYVAPFQEWLLRARGIDIDSDVEKARRSAGIRLGS